MKLIFDNINGNGEIYLDVLKAMCGDTKNKSMVDFGCNKAPYTCQLEFENRTYVDILSRILDEAKEQQYFVQDDALNYLNNIDKNFDVSISSDHIEHLTEMDGVKLLALMELSSKKQILFTPLGNHMVDKNDTNPENHHSGWLPEHFPDYAQIIFPNYHPQLGIGAFFVFKCENLEQEFGRVSNELKQKQWVKNLLA